MGFLQIGAMSVADMIEVVVDAITAFVSGFASALVSTAETLLFTTTGTGENAVTSLSAIGTIIFIAVGLGVAYWIIDKVLGLIRLRRAG